MIKISFYAGEQIVFRGKTGVESVDALPAAGYDKASVFAWNPGRGKQYLQSPSEKQEKLY